MVDSRNHPEGHQSTFGAATLARPDFAHLNFNAPEQLIQTHVTGQPQAALRWPGPAPRSIPNNWLGGFFAGTVGFREIDFRFNRRDYRAGAAGALSPLDSGRSYPNGSPRRLESFAGAIRSEPVFEFSQPRLFHLGG